MVKYIPILEYLRKNEYNVKGWRKEIYKDKKVAKMRRKGMLLFDNKGEILGMIIKAKALIFRVNMDRIRNGCHFIARMCSDYTLKNKGCQHHFKAL